MLCAFLYNVGTQDRIACSVCVRRSVSFYFTEKIMTETTSSSSQCCQSIPWVGYLFFIVVLIGTFVLGMLVVSVAERRAQHVKRNVIHEIKPDEMDAAKWGLNFPRQYESWKRTQELTPATAYGGSNPRDHLRLFPDYVVLFAGFGFSVEYKQARGHWFALEDVTHSLRVNEHSSAACFYCKSPDAPRLIQEMGDEAFTAKRLHELKDQVTHSISCYDCHDTTTLELRSLRPAVLEGFRSHGREMANLTHQEKRSATCAQCHSTYHFAEETGIVTFPWTKGLSAENVEEYYKEVGFSDWTHPISGVRMIKTRHPDYELYTTSLHYARNVSCSDCHLPYMTQGAEKFSDHHIRTPTVAISDPLSNITNTCSVCHRWSEADAKKQVEQIQHKVREVRDRGMAMLVRAHFDIAACMEAGATDEELAAVRDELRYAQMHWDFVASSNGMGFHAPQESQRILATALDRAAQVRLECAKILAKYGYSEVVYPDVSSKTRADAVVRQFLPGSVKPSLLKPEEKTRAAGRTAEPITAAVTVTEPTTVAAPATPAEPTTPVIEVAEETDPLRLANMRNPLFQSSLALLREPAVPVADSEATTEAEMKPYVDTIPGTALTFKMIPIKGGKFLMGSPETEAERQADEGPQIEIEVLPFWMEEHETTWEHFQQFALKHLRETRSASDTLTTRDRLADAMASPTPPWGIGSISHGNAGKPGFPASGMTIYAAQVYCKWLTSITGRYYRLPTEAEWEYACRAGTTTAFSFGDDDSSLDDYAWWHMNSGGSSQRVKTLKPNAWGLYDMHGNMSEWVLEQYARDTYTNRQPGTFAAPVRAPRGEGFGQIARGGNCENDASKDLRSARRLRSVEYWKAQDPQFPQSIWWATDAPYVGFRVVRPLNPPQTEAELKPYEPDPMVWLEYYERTGKE